MTTTIDEEVHTEPKIPDQKKMAPQPNYLGWNLATFCENTSRGGVDQFMPIFGSTLGGTALEIGIMTGVYSLINIFQILWAWLSVKLKKMKIFVLIGGIISTLLYLPLSLLQTGQMILLIIIRFIQGLIYAASPPAQSTLLAEHIPTSERATRIITFTRVSLLGAFCGTLIGGFFFSLFLDNFMLSYEEIFFLLFGWSLVLGLLASFIFAVSVSDSRVNTTLDPSLILHQDSISSPSRLTVLQKMQAYRQKFTNFWRFLVFASVFNLIIHLAAPFFVILTIETYQLSFFTTSVLTSVSVLVQVLISFLMSYTKILDRFGRKLPLIGGLITISGATFMVIMPYYFPIPVGEWCMVSWVCLGIGWGIYNGSLAVFLLDLVHPQYRMPLIASYNAITGIAMFVGAVGGGLIVELTNNLGVVFLLRTGFLILTLILLARVHEPTIPGIITHPFKYWIVKYTRLGTERGPSITFLPVQLRKLHVRNWLSLGRKNRNQKKDSNQKK